MGWAEHIARTEETRIAYKIFVGKPERKRPHGRPMCRWEDNMKLNLRKTGFGGVDWTHLAQHRTGGDL
jgi:hypothetical protein